MYVLCNLSFYFISFVNKREIWQIYNFLNGVFPWWPDTLINDQTTARITSKYFQLNKNEKQYMYYTGHIRHVKKCNKITHPDNVYIDISVIVT